MRIAVVAGRFPAVSETFISRQVLDLQRLGHGVDVYANRAGKTPEAGDPLAPVAACVRLRPRRNLSGLAEGARMFGHPLLSARLVNPVRYGVDGSSLRLLFSAVPYIDQGPYDVVLAHFGPNAAVVAKLRDAGLPLGPLVTFFHGSDVASATEREFALLFRTGERFVAVSEDLARRAAALGAPRERLHVLYNGVDLDRFSAPERAPRRAGDPLRLVSVARLAPVKGLEHAVAAVETLPEALRARVQYQIVGEGDLRGSLQEQIDRAGLGSVVTLRGGLPPAGVRAALLDADVFLFPSLNEGLGVAAIEAMGCGLPVIGSRIGGIPEVVDDGVTGLLVPVGDSNAIAFAIVQLAEDPGLAAAMGGAGRGRAHERFDAQTQMRRLLEIVDLARG